MAPPVARKLVREVGLLMLSTISSSMVPVQSYPYQQQQQSCTEASCTLAIPQGSITGYQDVTKDDTQALMDAVGKQPVSVLVHVTRTNTFELYIGDP